MQIRKLLDSACNSLIIFLFVAGGSAKAELVGLGASLPGPHVVMSLFSIDTDTGESTLIGSTGIAGLQGLAVNPLTGDVFSTGGYDDASAAGLYQIDPTTGSASYIGGTGNFVALDFSPDGVLYGVGALGNSDDGVGDDIYTIDLTTGLATNVIALGAWCCAGIAFSLDGSQIVYTWGGTQVSTIDPTSGTHTHIGPVGGGAVQRIATSPDGTIYNVNTTGPGAARLYTLDLSAPANVTLVGETGIFFTGLAFAEDEVASSDSDQDGVPDEQDNCFAVANADQRDSNGDGFGNVCDADLDNDCSVNFIDLGLMKAVFFTADANADLDGNGNVNFVDLGILKTGFFQPPGPSGITNGCE